MEFVFGIIIAVPVVVIYSVRLGRDEDRRVEAYIKEERADRALANSKGRK